MIRYLRSKTAALICAVVLLLSSFVSAKDKSKGPVNPQIHPDLLVEIAGLEIQKAQKPCDNWAWWTVIQSIFEQQNLPLPQSFFVDHADGGACLNEDHPLNLYDVATSATGDYALPNGTTFHADAKLGDMPVAVPMIVDALRAGRPLLMVWRKRPFVVQGIVFDDRVYPNGQHAFVAKELRLIDPTTAKLVKLTLDDDTLGEIVGTADIVVTKTQR